MRGKARETELKTGFLSWLKELNKESESAPIIVEGKKDLEALRTIGVTGIIYCVYGKSISNLADELSKYHTVIILTDFDAEGKKIKDKLIYYLQTIGVKIELKYRNEIKKLVKGRVRVIEGLDTFLINHGVITSRKL
ncbi:MAG: toprim domain-containing protein [Candidatus Odinarchaeia archaeon]